MADPRAQAARAARQDERGRRADGVAEEHSAEREEQHRLCLTRKARHVLGGHPIPGSEGVQSGKDLAVSQTLASCPLTSSRLLADRLRRIASTALLCEALLLRPSERADRGDCAFRPEDSYPDHKTMHPRLRTGEGGGAIPGNPPSLTLVDFPGSNLGSPRERRRRGLPT